MSVAPFVEIVPLTSADWPAVRAIYLEGIATGTATFETTAPEWEQWDAGHMPHSRLVARVENEVAGWAALSAVSSRRVYSGVAEVSVYVAASRRGGGIGSNLLDALVNESERQGIWTLQAGIFAENVPSLELHRKMGFRVVGMRERVGCLHRTWRDVMLLERRSKIAGV
jgi:L-amino acid N-acyltransferase YncA